MDLEELKRAMLFHCDTMDYDMRFFVTAGGDTYMTHAAISAKFKPSFYMLTETT